MMIAAQEGPPSKGTADDWPAWTDGYRVGLPWPPPGSAESAALGALDRARAELGRQPRFEEIAARAGRGEVITALALGELMARGLVRRCFYDPMAFRQAGGAAP